MSVLWPWAGLLLATAWASRCVQVGCARMLPVAGLTAGVCALATGPGQALRAAWAEWLIVAAQILAWAVAPMLAAAAVGALTGLLARVPVRAGSPGRWLLVGVAVALGITGALLLSRVTEVAQAQTKAAVAATVDFAVAKAAAVVPGALGGVPPSPVRDGLQRVACVASEPSPAALRFSADSSLEARWC